MASTRQSIGRGDELDATAVGAADHADAGIARPVELHAALGGHPVEELLHVLALVVGAVGLDRAAGLAEAPRVPGEHVVPGLLQRGDVERAEEADRLDVRVPGLAPARTHQHGRRRLVVGAGVDVAVDSGNQCARIFTPSNDVTSTSLGTPATGVLAGVGSTGRSQAGRLYAGAGPVHRRGVRRRAGGLRRRAGGQEGDDRHHRNVPDVHAPDVTGWCLVHVGSPPSRADGTG